MAQKDFITDESVLQSKTVPLDGARLSEFEKRDGSQDRLRPLKDARDAFERDYLVQVLSMTEGNVSQAAKLAGKYRADFYELLKKHDLKVEEFKRMKTGLPN
jgi:two-component system response regulator GlrR